MKSILSFILTIYEVTLFVAVCLTFYPVALLIFVFTAPFDKRRTLLHKFSCVWGSMYIWFQPFWKVTWEGKENIQDDQAYVLVSNHQSLLDIVVLYGLFKHFKWVAKNSLLKVPFVGWNMALNDYIIIKRNDAKSQIDMMKKSEKMLREGNSIMIFAEGTRSPDGNLGTFKRGAFIMAEKAEVPVIPIALDNMYKAVKKNSLWINKTTDMKVKIFPPLNPKDFKNTKEISAKVQEIIAGQLDEWRSAEK
ncbi:MAG: 1-acyl-sn-glycerol-3-phosphate acyltransferase [Spirochaetales bacterium]|nr:1-acyl-sn-glycerol-3-phosphate acyltransferase [Spirochaetales bacterium]